MNEPTLLNNSAQSSAKSKFFFFPSKMTCYWLHSSLLTASPSFPTGMIYDPWSAASVWSTQASCLWVKTEPACVYVWGCVCSSVWPRRTRRLTKEISEAPLATVFPWECSLKRCTSSNGGVGRHFISRKRGLGAQKQPCVGEDDKAELWRTQGWVESYCKTWSLHWSQSKRSWMFSRVLNVHSPQLFKQHKKWHAIVTRTY